MTAVKAAGYSSMGARGKDFNDFAMNFKLCIAITFFSAHFLIFEYVC